MSEETRAELEEVEILPGEILFRENDASYHFYILHEGEVEVYKRAPGGGKVRLAVVSAGSSIGEFAMIDRLPRSATAVALTTVKATKVSEEAYRVLLAELPDWAISVMGTLVARVRQMNEIVRSANNSPELVKELDTAEFTNDAGTIVDEVPFLGNPDEK